MLALPYIGYNEVEMSNSEFTEYLIKIKFQQRLKNIAKKLKNKTIVIYGTGMFFEVINKEYDLSSLNIIAISDKKFTEHTENQKFLGYNVCSPDEIKTLNPDYVLLGTKNIVTLLEDLEVNLLKNTKIKVRPLIKKPLKDLWEEI